MPNYAGQHNLKRCLLWKHQRCHLPCWQRCVDESFIYSKWLSNCQLLWQWLIGIVICNLPISAICIHLHSKCCKCHDLPLCLLPGGSHHRSLAKSTRTSPKLYLRLGIFWESFQRDVWQVAKGTIEANIIQLQTWGAHLNQKLQCETETFC